MDVELYVYDLSKVSLDYQVIPFRIVIISL